MEPPERRLVPSAARRVRGSHLSRQKDPVLAPHLVVPLTLSLSPADAGARGPACWIPPRGRDLVEPPERRLVPSAARRVRGSHLSRQKDPVLAPHLVVPLTLSLSPADAGARGPACWIPPRGRDLVEPPERRLVPSAARRVRGSHLSRQKDPVLAPHLVVPLTLSLSPADAGARGPACWIPPRGRDLVEPPERRLVPSAARRVRGSHLSRQKDPVLAPHLVVPLTLSLSPADAGARGPACWIPPRGRNLVEPPERRLVPSAARRVRGSHLSRQKDPVLAPHLVVPLTLSLSPADAGARGPACWIPPRGRDFVEPPERRLVPSAARRVRGSHLSRQKAPVLAPHLKHLALRSGECPG